MSEYRYYEFRALDRPLGAQQMQELRALSTRATITARRFVNTYHYGDFRGNAGDVLRQYFDAFVYTDSLGDRRLGLRFPLHSLPVEVVEPYLDAGEDGITLELARDRWVLWFQADLDTEADLSVSPPGRPGLSPSDSGELWMDALSGIRQGISRGDARALYLGWLVAFQRGAFADDTPEPPLPSGLRDLLTEQQTLTAFLGLDEDIVAAAAERSATSGPAVFSGRTVGELDDRVTELRSQRRRSIQPPTCNSEPYRELTPI